MYCILSWFKRRKRKAITIALQEISSAVSNGKTESLSVAEQVFQEWPPVKAQQTDLFSAVSEPKTELFAVSEPVVQECPPVRSQQTDLFSAVSEPKTELLAVTEPVVQECPPVRSQQTDLFSTVSEPKTELFAVTESVVHECPPVRPQQTDLFSAVSEPKTELLAVTEPVVQECPPEKSQQMELPSAFCVSKTKSLAVAELGGQQWPAIRPLQKGLREVMELQPSMLTDALYDFCTDQAYRFNNASPEFVMVSTLTCAAALIGTSCNLAPKRFDKSWVVSQALWGLNIGDPSKNKSGTMGVGHRLLKFAQKKVIDRNKIRREKEAAEACEHDSEDSPPIKVPPRNVIVQDCTPEALLLHLQENPNGCIVIRDEIYGWLSKMERGEHAEERALYTEGFAGNNDFVQKRVSRPPVILEDFFVCVFGCIQPDRLRPLLQGRAGGESNDGFFERFQMIIYDDTTAKYTDHKDNPELLNKMQHVFCCLASLYENNTRLTFNFSEEAQDLWNSWASAQCDLMQHADISDQAVMGKYPSLVAKLSLILQLFSEAESAEDHMQFVPSAAVGLMQLQKAIELSNLLMSHNRRIQGLLTMEAEIEPALILLKNLQKLPKEFDFRTLYRKKWRGLTQIDECQRALDALEEHGYVRSINCYGQNGRSLLRYEVHPSVRNK